MFKPAEERMVHNIDDIYLKEVVLLANECESNLI